MKASAWRSIVSLLLGLFPLSLCQCMAVPGKTPVVCRVELDKEVFPAGEKQRAVVRVVMDTSHVKTLPHRSPVNVAIVLDHSGSMGGDKLVHAQNAAIEAIRRLGPSDVFSVLAYNHQVQTVIPARKAVDTESIERRIRNIEASGNTALFAGVSQGAAEVRKHLRDEYLNRIVLLSDGLANVGPSSPEDLGRLGSALFKEGISVSTVGVGADYDEDLMGRLAWNADGYTYFVRHHTDLPEIFSKELGNVLRVAAKRVHLKIEFAEGVRPVRTLGLDGRVRGNTVELSLNQLYGGQKKYAMVEVDLAPGKHDESRHIAVAHLDYTNAANGKQETSWGTADVRFSEDREEVVLSYNKDLQREYNLNLNAMAQDEAIRLSDSGQLEEAALELKQSAKLLKEAAKDLGGDKALETKAKEMEKEAETVEQQPFDPVSRKRNRAEQLQQLGYMR